MSRRFVLQLVLPLLGATILSCLVHLRWPADGFFLNLAAGFVGSLVTIGYIDWVLRSHEIDRWKDADLRINRRLTKLSNSTITGIRISFGFGTEMFDQVALESGDPELMRKEVLRVATYVLLPVTAAKVKSLDEIKWKTLVRHLDQASVQCGLVLDRFGHRLDQTTISVVLDLQQHLEAAQTFHRTFPDIAGVPPDRLPKTKTPPQQLQSDWCDITAKDLRRVLELSVKLSVGANGS
jgi:hypothetical protein